MKRKTKKIKFPYYKNKDHFGLWLKVTVCVGSKSKRPKKPNAKILCPMVHNCWVLMDDGEVCCPHWDWITLPKTNDGVKGRIEAPACDPKDRK